MFTCAILIPKFWNLYEFCLHIIRFMFLYICLTISQCYHWKSVINSRERFSQIFLKLKTFIKYLNVRLSFLALFFSTLEDTRWHQPTINCPHTPICTNAIIYFKVVFGMCGHKFSLAANEISVYMDFYSIQKLSLHLGDHIWGLSIVMAYVHCYKCNLIM